MKQHFSQVSLFNTKMTSAVPLFLGSGGGRRGSSGGRSCSGSLTKAAGSGSCSGAMPQASSYHRSSRGSASNLMKIGLSSDSVGLIKRSVSHGKLLEQAEAANDVPEMRLDEELRSLVLQVREGGREGGAAQPSATGECGGERGDRCRRCGRGGAARGGAGRGLGKGWQRAGLLQTPIPS